MVANPTVADHQFLAQMYLDSYFPNFLVDKGKCILLDLCSQIEREEPQDLDALYCLTHAATNAFNDLASEFENNESEIETMARDCMGMDFDFIAKSVRF